MDTVTLFSKLNQKVNYPKMTFDPFSVEVTYVTLPKDHFIQVPWKYVKVCGYSDLFFQKLEPKVMDPQMTFDPKSVEYTCVTLPKDPCVQVPWEYINVCGYSDQFCKIAHTHTYIIDPGKLTTPIPLFGQHMCCNVYILPYIPGVIFRKHNDQYSIFFF